MSIETNTNSKTPKSKTSHAHVRGKKPAGKKDFSKSSKKNAPKIPLMNFLSFELTAKKNSAAIIKINQLAEDDKGNLNFESLLFSNNGKKISPEAFSYHKITEESLQGKPLVSEHNFNKSQFIVFWDGEVARQLLRTNKVKKYAPIINLHTLARYLNDHPKPIKLIEYAKEVLPQKRLQLEIKLRNPNSKIEVLPDILDSIKSKYLEKYGENSPRFLSVLSRSKNRKDFEERLDKYMAIRKELDAKAAKANKGKNAPQQQLEVKSPEKKVINVTISANNGAKNQNNTIKMAVVKRKKPA